MIHDIVWIDTEYYTFTILPIYPQMHLESLLRETVTICIQTAEVMAFTISISLTHMPHLHSLRALLNNA